MNAKRVVHPKQVVLILQGGGALGAYQAGVYEAMHRFEMEPAWVAGTSIGAINSAIIAGNPPEKRMGALSAFWDRMGQGLIAHADQPFPFIGFGLQWDHLMTFARGLPNFFVPRGFPWFAMGGTVAPDTASIYDTAPLKRTLNELVDFEYLNHTSPVRLSVGAVDVESGEMRYFDSKKEPIRVEHILASGALPPAFPAVEIDGRYYWDGGIHSNTPLEWILQDYGRKDSVCFLANLWPQHDKAPGNLQDVLRRAKELQYASRSETLAMLESRVHSLRHMVQLLSKHLPDSAREIEDVALACEYGCVSTYHLVRLQAPRLLAEGQAKDIEFSPSRVEQRWIAGFLDARRAIDDKPWLTPVSFDQGVILHDFTTDPHEHFSHNEWYRKPTSDGMYCLLGDDSNPST